MGRHYIADIYQLYNAEAGGDTSLARAYRIIQDSPPRI